MHQVLFLFLGEFSANIPEFLDPDQEQDGFHIGLFAKSLYQPGFQVPPSGLEVILRLLHPAKIIYILSTTTAVP